MTILRLTEGLREKDSQIKILRNDLKKSEELRLNYALTINTMANYSLSAELKKYFGTIILSRIKFQNLFIFVFLFLIIWYLIIYCFTSILN